VGPRDAKRIGDVEDFTHIREEGFGAGLKQLPHLPDVLTIQVLLTRIFHEKYPG
jgi:hypothetical protein